MMIDEHRLNEKGHRLREQKEIKVKIPLDYHVRLHTTKVVDGQSISETVQKALANYFATLGAENGMTVGEDAASSGLATPAERASNVRGAVPELRTP